MDFYYDPILGLQFTCGYAVFEVDLDVLSENEYDFEKWIKFFNQTGVCFRKPFSKEITNIYTQITSNVLL